MLLSWIILYYFPVFHAQTGCDRLTHTAENENCHISFVMARHTENEIKEVCINPLYMFLICWCRNAQHFFPPRNEYCEKQMIHKKELMSSKAACLRCDLFEEHVQLQRIKNPLFSKIYHKNNSSGGTWGQIPKCFECYHTWDSVRRS